MTWIDVSMPLRNGMDHWPGDPEFLIEPVRSIASGDDYNLTKLRLSAHTGTHVDAPLHFLEGGAPVDLLSLDALVGAATVVEGTDAPEHCDSRMLFKCGTQIPLATAQALIGLGVRTVGIDSLSIGDEHTHRALLSAGVCIIEGLDLAAAAPGRYELICLPLRIEGGDGAPARALLRAIS